MFEKDFEGELKDCDNAITFLTVCLLVFVAGIFLFNVIADGNISVILFI